MPYVLGIDLGHTRTRAAVCRYGDGTWTAPEVAPLDGGRRWVDSAVHIASDGAVLAGHAVARQQGPPERTVRGLPHRVGDPVPVVVGSQAYPGETLAAALAGWVSDQLATSFGEPARQIVLTHPAGWGPHRRRVLHDALEAARLPGALVLPAPVAVAEWHAAAEQVDVDSVLAVCRLGGERVESSVLRRGNAGFDLLARATSPDPNAGTVIDDLLVEHVLDGLDDPPSDPRLRARLRHGCLRAKELLAEQREAVIPVPAAGDIPISRRELDHIAAPVLRGAADQLARLAACVPADDLSAVVLAGGTARMRQAATLTEAALRRNGHDCPVRVGEDPAHAVCQGAALIARRRLAPDPEPASVAASHPAIPRQPVSGGEHEPDEIELGSPPPRPPVEITPLEPPPRRSSVLLRRGARGANRDGDDR
ncbi:Hsp70 family protein [Haloechinothrix salitolerans]|uniref:Hsp70 family protein n=1 Tax=Haloechinothrix salitolerans TaxID=926830 RepID=A0ABW2BT96_9PSEU